MRRDKRGCKKLKLGCLRSIYFINEFTPLDKSEIEVCSKHGIQTKVSGIHIGFMESRYYVNFRAPPQSDLNSEKLSPDEEEWLEYMVFIEEDLHWLLKLPYHRFWSQIVYDENLHRCLESYLSQAPRDYDIPNLNLREDLLSALKKVHKLVFLVYLRMSTCKESKQNHLTPSAFGEMVYDNFIFDIPKLMDLCALYGLKNSALLSKMMQNIFSTQPKYMDDLNETSKMILTVFNLVEEKLLDISVKKSHTASENGEICELVPYHDVLNYITDKSFTLYSFIETYPESCQIFNQNGVIVRLPIFYEQAFSILEKEMSNMGEDLENNSAFEDIKGKITLSKTLLVKIFRSILNYAYIQNLLTAKGSEKDEKASVDLLAEEGYLEVMLELISSKSFLIDYNLLYPLDEDLVFFNEIEIHLDPEKVNRIFCVLLNDDSPQTLPSSSSVSNGARPKSHKSSPENSQEPRVKSLQGLADLLRDKPPENSDSTNQIFSKKKGIIPDHEELKSLVQSVLDILNGYGEGFIQKCLEHYDYESEQVINALLSDSLPDHLSCLDKQMDWNSTNKEIYTVLSERKNVFDNDEFDIFSRNNVNMENIHKGKKNKTSESYQSLQKDKDSEFLKELTLNYEYEEDDSRVNLYEDEYDDTYDSVMIGLKEPEIDPDDDVEEKEPPKRGDDLRDKPQDFCINPEILRERRNKFRQDVRPGGSRPTGNDRQQKDRSKAKVGNHNRRKQSDFKRSRGMGAFPPR
ncbi:activating signal cointegrator 1 complex subunit 2 isoform X2 [Parasteatoda tepidariorum]|uniref:activating signal cointegrator 1 complex subunit 2 isoform X2 n=1 Tax=Parasteatoda tepidariorum TaxID=114398 RepID=UPI0039BC36A9